MQTTNVEAPILQSTPHGCKLFPFLFLQEAFVWYLHIPFAFPDLAPSCEALPTSHSGHAPWSRWCFCVPDVTRKSLILTTIPAPLLFIVRTYIHSVPEILHHSNERVYLIFCYSNSIKNIEVSGDIAI